MNKRTLREVMNTNHEEHTENWWIQIVKNTQRNDDYKNTQRSDEYKQWWTQSDNTNSEVMNTNSGEHSDNTNSEEHTVKWWIQTV